MSVLMLFLAFAHTVVDVVAVVVVVVVVVGLDVRPRSDFRFVVVEGTIEWTDCVAGILAVVAVV